MSMSQNKYSFMIDNKLKIRIQIQQPHQAIEEIYPELAEPEIEYEQSWDWQRIFVVILILLSILALMGYMIFNATKSESSVNEKAVAAINQTITAQENSISAEKAAPEPAMTNKTKSIESSKLLTESKHSPDIIQPRDTTKSVKIANPAEQTTAPLAKPKPEPKIHKPTVIPRKKPETISQTKPQKTLNHPPQVFRAQLSHAIRAREPVDAIDSVQLQPGESRPIYFFLHLKDLQGKKVSIHWYHDDTLDSQLSLQIHNNNWRTNASKQLDHQRLGAWRVELLSESGILLATRNFTVTER